jgi:hypothetical protein
MRIKLFFPVNIDESSFKESPMDTEMADLLWGNKTETLPRNLLTFPIIAALADKIERAKIGKNRNIKKIPLIRNLPWLY